MYWYYKEKLHADHFWKLKSDARILLGKITWRECEMMKRQIVYGSKTYPFSVWFWRLFLFIFHNFRFSFLRFGTLKCEKKKNKQTNKQNKLPANAVTCKWFTWNYLDMMFDIHTEDNSKTGDYSTKPGSLRGSRLRGRGRGRKSPTPVDHCYGSWLYGGCAFKSTVMFSVKMSTEQIKIYPGESTSESSSNMAASKFSKVRKLR